MSNFKHCTKCLPCERKIKILATYYKQSMIQTRADVLWFRGPVPGVTDFEAPKFGIYFFKGEAI